MFKYVSLQAQLSLKPVHWLSFFHFLRRPWGRSQHYIIATHKALAGDVDFQDFVFTKSLYSKPQTASPLTVIQAVTLHICQYVSQEAPGKETRLSNWKVMKCHCLCQGVLQLERGHALQRNSVQQKYWFLYESRDIIQKPMGNSEGISPWNSEQRSALLSQRLPFHGKVKSTPPHFLLHCKS